MVGAVSKVVDLKNAEFCDRVGLHVELDQYAPRFLRAARALHISNRQETENVESALLCWLRAHVVVMALLG